MTAISVGLDFGSTGLRLAYGAPDGQIVGLPAGFNGEWPWIVCERAPETATWRGFAPLKSKLGSTASVPMPGGHARPIDVVAQALRACRGAAEEHSCQTVGHLGISVPARYSSAQRQALRDAALAAGYAEAHLVNDSVAAVLAAGRSMPTGATCLVYSMGYLGFEVGLIRSVRDHHRALGYEGAGEPGGAWLDNLVLRGWISLLSQELLDAVEQWDDGIWLQLRAAAQDTKEALSRDPQATFPVLLPGGANGRGQQRVQFRQADFVAATAPVFRATLDQAIQLLEQANLTPADVDTVLLVGGTTRVPSLRQLIQEVFGKAPVALEPDALARGAALYVARIEPTTNVGRVDLERGVGGVGALGPQAPAAPGLPAHVVQPDAPLGTTAPAPDAESISALNLPRTGPPPDPQAVLEHARRLLARGQRAQAEAYLQSLLDAIQRFVASLPSAQSAATTAASGAGAPTSRRASEALRRAEQLLLAGKLDEAVRASHEAWLRSPDSPDTFTRMIDVHCRAADAGAARLAHDDIIRWLGCAAGHDQGNMRVRHALAEEYYQHGKRLADAGQRPAALRTIQDALQWNPEHAGALRLEETLTRPV